MIKDISIIQNELCDYSEVDMPYEFERNCHIKYITKVKEDEFFFKGGKFISRCNDIIILDMNGKQKRVPICMRNKDGEIIYCSRFFIKENTNNDTECKNDNELKKTIDYQQNIIENLVDQLKKCEIIKHEYTEKIEIYENLLDEGRYKIKELSEKLDESNKKNEKYELLIKGIYNSR